MKKEVKKSGYKSKKVYLLGMDNKGFKYYLEEPSWDCKWYWGFGYVETYNNNNTHADISEHQHFNSLFFKQTANCLDCWNGLIVDNTLNEKEIFKLLELMKSFYILKDAAELFYRGGSHISSNPCFDILKSEKKWKEINEILLPEIFKEIKKIFENKPEDDDN